MTPAILAAALASVVRAPWVLVTAPWVGFNRGPVDVLWDPFVRSWCVRVSRPEVEGECTPVAGEWWDVLAAIDAGAHP